MAEMYFVHGNQFMPQNGGGGNASSPGPLLHVDGVAWTDVLGAPFGWGKTFRGKGGGSVFFHVCIPTPTLRGSGRVRLDEVSFQYIANAGCHVSAVHAWDGFVGIQHFNGLNLTGDRSTSTAPNINVFRPRDPSGGMHLMSFGVGLSIGVTFQSDSNVHFAGAGASFQLV